MFQKSWRLALLIWDVYVTSAVYVLWMSGYGVSGAGSCFPWKQNVDYLKTMLCRRAPWQGNGSNSSHQKKSSVIACVPRLEAHNQLEEIGLDHNRIKLDKQTPFFSFPWFFDTGWVAWRSHGFSTARRNHGVSTFSVTSTRDSRWTTLIRKDGSILAVAPSCLSRVLNSVFQGQLTEVLISPERCRSWNLNSPEDTDGQTH